MSVMLLVAVLATIAVLAMVPSPRDPVYDGKQVSEWLRQPLLFDSVFGPVDVVDSWNADVKFDSNALPYLVKALRKTDGPFHRPYATLFGKLSGRVQAHLPWPGDAWILRANAALALGKMGQMAEPAVPVLIAMMKDEKVTSARICAAQALGEIGDNQPAVMDALQVAQIDTNMGVAVAAKEARARLTHNPH